MKNKLAILPYLLTFILIFPSVIALSNAAQPGIRNAGGMGGFTLLFPKDSIHYQKIQMQKERVSIQLYKGFAVVKGEYWMYNHSDEIISMQSGYPINANYSTYKDGYDLTEIWFDTLYQIKVKVDGVPTSTQFNSFQEEDYSNHIEQYNNNEWHTWETSYKANGTTRLEVYFILETNDANIRQGYNGKDYNSFIYVLETGATWKPPIGEGTVLVELMDGLNVKDIEGISPFNIFSVDKEKNRLLYQFENLEPTREDNIAITYYKRDEAFDLKKTIANSDSYFLTIDQLATTQLNKKNYDEVQFESPFEIPDTASLFIGGFFIGIILLGIAFLCLIIYIIRRLFFRKR